MSAAVHIRAGRVKPVLGRHPWVFAGSIERVDGEPAPGDEVDLLAPDGRFLARGLYSPDSQIRVRTFAYEREAHFDAAWIAGRLAAARAYREALGLPAPDTTGYRLVHSEADQLPGLIVDVFGDAADPRHPVLVVQLSTQATDRRRETILDALDLALAPRAIVEANDPHRALEGLPPSLGLRRGELPGSLVVAERGLRFPVDLEGGQKTGCYYDQRDTRARVESLSRGRRVLDAFCYGGGFALAAARGGAAAVLAVDSSAAACALARRAAELAGAPIEVRQDDVFRLLGELRRGAERYDLVVLDPPRYAGSRAQLGPALQKYRELAGLGLAATAPGGWLILCSCSGLVDDEAFESTAREAAQVSGRRVRIAARGGQAPDHPVSLYCPEGRYLKVLYCHVE